MLSVLQRGPGSRRVVRTPRRRTLLGHRHRFRWAGDDVFSSAGLYACRCGVVRPGL